MRLTKSKDFLIMTPNKYNTRENNGGYSNNCNYIYQNFSK